MMQKVGESEYGQAYIKYVIIFMLGGLWEVCPFFAYLIPMTIIHCADRKEKIGYKALAETFTPILLAHSNIERDTPFRFVRYDMEKLLVHGRERTGYSSENFLKYGESIITLSHLFKQYLCGSIADVLGRLSSDKSE